MVMMIYLFDIHNVWMWLLAVNHGPFNNCCTQKSIIVAVIFNIRCHKLKLEPMVVMEQMNSENPSDIICVQAVHRARVVMLLCMLAR